MASIILVTIDLLACGFFLYVLLEWMRETNRKRSPSGSKEGDLSSPRLVDPASPRHVDKKNTYVLTIKASDKDCLREKTSAPRHSTPHRTHTISSLRPK
jgi:hypothetical protein